MFQSYMLFDVVTVKCHDFNKAQYYKSIKLEQQRVDMKWNKILYKLLKRMELLKNFNLPDIQQQSQCTILTTLYALAFCARFYDYVPSLEWKH